MAVIRFFPKRPGQFNPLSAAYGLESTKPAAARVQISKARNFLQQLRHSIACFSRFYSTDSKDCVSLGMKASLLW